MRTTALVLFVALARVCAPELAPAALAAHHGGVVVATDDRAVEVSVAGNSVEAWVVDADGVPIEASADPITITVQAETGPTPVVVVWDPVTHSYKGTAPTPVVAGPVEVTVVVAGEPRVGRVETIVIVPAAAAPPTTTVVVEGPSRPSVVVERPSRPGVTVVAPDPRPSVVVVPPSPPGVVIVPPRPPGVVIAPPRPPGIVVVPPSPGVVVIDRDRDDRHDEDHHSDEHHDHGRHRGHGGGRGHGRGH